MCGYNIDEDKFMKKQHFHQLLGVLGALTFAITGGLIISQLNSFIPMFGNRTDYTITMDSSTTEDWDFLSHSGYSTSYKTFRYTNFTFENTLQGTENGHSLQLQKGGNGKVYNTTPINGFMSLSVTYTSDTNLIAYFGNETNPTSNNLSLASGTSYNLSNYSNNTYLSITTGSKYARINSITITYSCIPSSEISLESLLISSLPNKTVYMVGDSLDLSGLAIDAVYTDGSKKDVTDVCNISPTSGTTLSTAGEQTITCKYSEEGIDVETSFKINVITPSSDAPEIIVCEGYITTYNLGDALDLSNVKVIAMYEDGREIDVADACTFNPPHGTILDTIGQQTVTCTHVPTGLDDDFTITVLDNAQSLTKQDVKYDYLDYSHNNIYNTPAMPSKGDAKALVVPVWFSDSSTYVNASEKEQIKEDIETAYFGEAHTSTLPWHSVKSFYYTESRGTFNLDGMVADWYDASDYSARTISDTDVDSLVSEVGDYMKQKLGKAAFDEYDTDKDGYIDALILIYAAPNYTNDSRVSESLWAYCFWLQETNNVTNNPIINTYFWASYDFMYENRDYGDNVTIDAHTYIHEMGHVLGLDDYYDYAGVNNPAAGFSMQDYNVGAHDPFSQMALGWVEPYVPTESITIEINSFQESGDIVLLSPDWDGSPFDEYLLLELYTPTGLNENDVNNSYAGSYPQGPDDIGIRLWHVDARLRKYQYSSFDTSNHYTEFDGYDYSIGPTNTSYKEGYDDYYARVPEDRYYDLLALIRNERANDVDMLDNLNSSMLFKTGDTFSMEQYADYFYKGPYLDRGLALGYTFEILEIDETNLSATIHIEKV